MTSGRSFEKAVILGAAGFMGVNLARVLAARGVSTVLFDRGVSPHWPEGAEIVIGDIAAPPEVLRVHMAEAVVFHLAGAIRPMVSTEEISAQIAREIGATVALLEWSRDCPCRWIFASSGGAVYGEARTPLLSETHPTDPVSTYGIMKLAVEKYFHVYRMLHGTEYIIARIANPFGPFQRPNTGQGLVATLVNGIRRGECVEIWGDGGNVRDYLHIDDTIEALIRLATHGSVGGIYNVGSGIGTSINELVDLIAQIGGCVPIIVHSPPRRIDVRRNILDTRRINQETGWTVTHSQREGLQHVWDWFGKDCTVAHGDSRSGSSPAFPSSFPE